MVILKSPQLGKIKCWQLRLIPSLLIMWGWWWVEEAVSPALESESLGPTEIRGPLWSFPAWRVDLIGTGKILCALCE